MLFAFHQHEPLPLAMQRTDKILPRFVSCQLSGGLAGFIVAAIVAAALSPFLNARAATTVNDSYRPFVRPLADEPTLMRVSRLATVLWGVVQLLVALGSQWMDRSVLEAGLAVLSLTAGPVLGAFLLGVLSRRVTAAAMVAGMSAGIAALVWLWWTSAVGWTWYAFLGASVTCAAALLATPALARHAAAPGPPSW